MQNKWKEIEIRMLMGGLWGVTVCLVVLLRDMNGGRSGVYHDDGGGGGVE